MKTESIKIFLVSIFLWTNSTLQSYSQVDNKKGTNHFDNISHSQTNNFIKFFPDTALAIFVAGKLNKEISDNVTTKELASIKGDFDIGTEEVSSLKGIGYLTGIDTFHCDKNEVTEIPAEIGKLTNLQYLDLCKAFELKKIPKEIGLLKNLKMIRLSLTEVSSIPKEIGNLSQLRILWISSNNLTEIPKEIGNLTNLVDLDIHSNNIPEIPNEICNLTSLTSLNISYCGLKQLPENIGNLKELKSLNLFKNDLKYLPKSIINLDKLSYLNVYDNFKLSESYKTYLPKLLRKKK
jgi:Leucine-rich repeat (LRR) protein